MAAVTSYTTLVQNIQAAAEDDGVEFAAYIPTAIDMAEERLIRELDLPDLEIKATGSLTQDNRFLTKPTGLKFVHHFKINSQDRDVILQKRMEDYIIDYWPNITTADVPKYYCEVSSTQFRLAPTPNAAFPYEIKYTAQPTKLSTTNSTNYFTEKCQDALFAACMIEIAKFMKAWSQVQFWEAQFVQIRDGWNVNQGRVRRDNGSVPNAPDSGPNSLKHTIQSNS